MDNESLEKLDECKYLLLNVKEVIDGIYEFKDLVSYIDIALDEVRRLENVTV